MPRRRRRRKGGGQGGGSAAGDGAPVTGAPTEKPWGGRFEKPTNAGVEAYTSSVKQDAALLPYDIAASIAHASMLAKQRIIKQADADAIIAGLSGIARDAMTGAYQLRDELEDVHMNVEAELERRIGPAAGRLHTARSRNDQVVTDFRMAVRDAAREMADALVLLQEAIVALAEQHLDTVMPGYTHLQPAQPVLLAHHLMAYREMFHRDELRFAQTAGNANVSPLGSGALAGVPYPIDRDETSGALGFAELSFNSMDAVSDRDFVIDFHAAAATCMMHFSRLAEELILWSTREFGFISFDDAFATGSSIMPQKKNPDVAELARGRTGIVYGNLMAALTLMKGLPLTYNRDLQEDKEPLFSSTEIVASTTGIFTEMLPTITWHVERMRQAATTGYSLATDVADFLVKKGMPFREAHTVVGRLVRYAESRAKDLPELTLEEYRQFSPLFDGSVLKISLDSAIDARNAPGGTARASVRDQIGRARDWFEAARSGMFDDEPRFATEDPFELLANVGLGPNLDDARDDDFDEDGDFDEDEEMFAEDDDFDEDGPAPGPLPFPPRPGPRGRGTK